MNEKFSAVNVPILLEVDLHRTERVGLRDETFHWDGDDLIFIGHGRLKMSDALSPLSHSLRESFKQHVISFSKQDDYLPYSYLSIFSALNAALKASPTSTIDAHWIAQALTKPSFLQTKRAITRFFLHWQERDTSALNSDIIRLLNDTAAHRKGPRNVLSDNPEKSWLTDEEYEHLLRKVWDNYDSGISDTQVTLIKLLSMQYSRRPAQINLLKLGDVRESDGTDTHGLIGRFINFPGVKDIDAETGFRDSKFEPHILADHLWDLYTIQRYEIKELFEHTLGLSLSADQLKKLPLFCSETRIKEARKLIEHHYKLELVESLDNDLFHLRKGRIIDVIKWTNNSPNCTYGKKPTRQPSRPKPPISPRTGQIMVVTATRMRHTRARQLARLGVPKHILSHWLGHTRERSLDAYYNDPAEQARKLDEAMASTLSPLAMAFAGTLLDSDNQAIRADESANKLEFASAGELKSVGRCGKHSFCATTSVPIPCYRCKHFEPLVDAPHHEVLDALIQRQAAEKKPLMIGGQRNLLIPIDLSSDIRAVENCIMRCNNRKAERKIKP